MAGTSTSRSWFALLACCGAVSGCAGTSSAGAPQSCDGVSCGDFGSCFVEGGLAWCDCVPGYHPDGPACAEDHPSIPCDGVRCTDHGWCRVAASGMPTCDCFDGYHRAAGSDLVCLADAVADAGPDTGDAAAEDAAIDEAEAREADAADDGGDTPEDSAVEADASCPGELGGPCEPVRRCGCDDGRRCVVTGSVDSFVEACVPAGGSPEGAACVPATDDCAAGMQCLTSFGQFVCQRFCRGTADCDATSCLRNGWFPGATYGFCSPAETACAALSGTGCTPIQACRVIPGSTLRTYCGTAGPGGEGADCLTDGCASGYACTVVDTAQTICVAYCLVADPSTCAGGVCTDSYGNGSVGLCLP